MADALNFERTITTLDDVFTWMRDLHAATFPIDPETRGKDIIELDSGARSFTDEQAGLYDDLWLDATLVCNAHDLDVNAVALEIMGEFSPDEDEEDPDATTYMIVRFYAGDHEREVIATGLTLAEAEEHCEDPETSSRTATSPEAVARTEEFGAWFDGRQAE